MAVIYLRHPVHGEKVASTEAEAAHDRENGWEDFDPTKGAAPVAPQVPSFLVPVESDLPEDFPGRKELIAAGVAMWADVADLDRDGLIALKGIGEKTADAILKVMES
jgi:hypothetical protein